MNFREQSKTEKILTVMKIFAWIAFFGFCIQSGAYLISYVLSFFNPQVASDIYGGLNLIELRENNFITYSILMACLVMLVSLKANVWYKVIGIISTIKIENPFTLEITHRLENISYLLLAIWILGFISNSYADWLAKKVEINTGFFSTLNSGEFLFMAGLLFIVSQIFKRGVELQSENELTV